jgi:uncharacterized damage-inducible protein DinB
MTVDDIRTLYAYNRWANRRLLDAVRSLPLEALAQDLRTSHTSIRGTLSHILLGEWRWLQVWRAQFSTGIDNEEPPSEALADIPSLEARWASVARDQDTFIEALTETALGTPVPFERTQGQRWRFPLAQLMQHVVNHSSYHRGQVVTLLRQLGRTPPVTDFHVFLNDAASGAA